MPRPTAINTFPSHQDRFSGGIFTIPCIYRISSLNPRIRKEIADGFIVVDAADGFGENGSD